MSIPFLRSDIESGRLELLVDGSIYPTMIVCKAAYVFLDRGYFFFRREGEHTIVVITPKPDTKWTNETLALEYADELLSTLLRDTIERENRVIRETIIETALRSYVDASRFVAIPGSPQHLGPQSHEVDEILRGLQQDPALQIDENEIDRILAEIERETATRPLPTIDPNKVKNAKAKLHSR